MADRVFFGVGEDGAEGSDCTISPPDEKKEGGQELGRFKVNNRLYKPDLWRQM